MTPQEAHDTYEEHFKLYPDLKIWHMRAVAESEQLGYTLTPFARYRYGVEPTQVQPLGESGGHQLIGPSVGAAGDGVEERVRRQPVAGRSEAGSQASGAVVQSGASTRSVTMTSQAP